MAPHYPIDMSLDARNLPSVFANNKGADQAAHPRRLISAFVIRLLIVPYLNVQQAKFQSNSQSL